MARTLSSAGITSAGASMRACERSHWNWARATNRHPQRTGEGGRTERWTSLDRALQVAADEGAGVADLRPGASSEDTELRLFMVGRAAKLERWDWPSRLPRANGL